MPRPVVLTPELQVELCERLAENAGSLRRVCAAADMPLERTVRRWCVENPDFESAYARAKLMGIDASIDETLDIADDASNDWMERLGKEGQPVGWQVNGDHVTRSRLRIETRRWIAERTAAKKYGTKTGVDLTSSDGSMATTDATQRATRAAALLKLAQARKALDEVDIDDLV